MELETIVRFWCHLANREPLHSATSNANINKNTATSLLFRLTKALHKMESVEEWRFEHVVVDETFVGKRLYHSGKRVRARGLWIVTVTERDKKTGKSGRTVWTPVKKRSKEQLSAIIVRHTVGAKSLVYSDCFKGYSGLGSIRRLKQVNHSEGFKDGEVHTNNAEGVHGNIKSAVRKAFGGFGKNTREMRRKISFATTMWNQSQDTEGNSFGKRMRVIFKAVKYYQSTRKGYLYPSATPISGFCAWLGPTSAHSWCTILCERGPQPTGR